MAQNWLSRGSENAIFWPSGPKTQFSDHLGSASKVQDLLLIAKRSNIIPHFLQKFLCLVTIFLLKPKKAIFCLFWGLCQNSEKSSMVTLIFPSISWITMKFWAYIQSFIEKSMREFFSWKLIWIKKVNFDHIWVAMLITLIFSTRMIWKSNFDPKVTFGMYKTPIINK